MMNRDKIDLERGDEDVVFIQTDLDMEKISEEDQPRKILKEKMEKKDLKWENARIIGLFTDEFALMLDEDGKVELNGETIYSR